MSKIKVFKFYVKVSVSEFPVKLQTKLSTIDFTVFRCDTYLGTPFTFFLLLP